MLFRSMNSALCLGLFCLFFACSGGNATTYGPNSPAHGGNVTTTTTTELSPELNENKSEQRTTGKKKKKKSEDSEPQEALSPDEGEAPQSTDE